MEPKFKMLENVRDVTTLLEGAIIGIANFVGRAELSYLIQPPLNEGERETPSAEWVTESCIELVQIERW